MLHIKPGGIEYNGTKDKRGIILLLLLEVLLLYTNNNNIHNNNNKGVTTQYCSVYRTKETLRFFSNQLY